MDEISATLTPPAAQPRVSGASAASRSETEKQRPETKRQAAEPAQEAPEAAEGDPIAKAESVINQLVEFADQPNSRLKIELHENTGRFVYKAVNTESGEVLKQYPAEEVLRQIEFFREIQGLAVNRTA